MTGPYIQKNPGDLILAEDWNEVQEKIQEDIGEQINEALDNLPSVPNADNADKLDGNTLEKLSEMIVQQALQKIPERTGYATHFKRLTVGEEQVVEHQLHNIPLVDACQLDYFKVVCEEDDVREIRWVIFYLYHSKEKTITFKPDSGPNEKVKVERTDGPPYRIAFADMLQRYKVPYTESSTLGDLETEFWKAFDRNGEFEDIQYCHSPWFTGCCREEKTVKALKRSGDWDDLWFQMRPRKTDNLVIQANTAAATIGVKKPPTPAPSQLEVSHFDFDTMGVTLTKEPLIADDPDNPMDKDFVQSILEELNVMLMLKV